jgi:hypothetical protein
MASTLLKSQLIEARQWRLLASLAESGQVVPAEGQANRYVVIDGYKGSRRWSNWAGIRWKRWCGP